MRTPASEPTRVLLIDDQHLMLEGLRSIIGETDDLRVVGEAESAAEARHLLDDTRPDVALVGLHLGDRAGLEICGHIHAEHPGVACVALTSSFDDELLHEAFTAGISGYLLTQSRCTDLVDAVRDVASGGAVLDPAVARRLVDMLHESPTIPPEVEGLNARKRRLLKLVAEGHTTAQISEAAFVSEKTVRNQLSLLVQELGLSSRDELTALAKSLNRPALRWCPLI
jgi:DNA-binding NarL/FixJ family response regulator